MTEKQNRFGGRPGADRVKHMRREHPSGWLELSMYESLALMIDAIIDAPPDYTFSNPELAARAGVSDESVRNHIETLEELGVISPGERSTTFQVNEDSRVLREIFGLNDAVNAVRAGDSPFVSHLESGLSESDLESHIPDENMDQSDPIPAPGAKDIDLDRASSLS